MNEKIIKVDSKYYIQRGLIFKSWLHKTDPYWWSTWGFAAGTAGFETPEQAEQRWEKYFNFCNQEKITMKKL